MRYGFKEYKDCSFSEYNNKFGEFYVTHEGVRLPLLVGFQNDIKEDRDIFLKPENKIKLKELLSMMNNGLSLLGVSKYIVISDRIYNDSRVYDDIIINSINTIELLTDGNNNISDNPKFKLSTFLETFDIEYIDKESINVYIKYKEGLMIIGDSKPDSFIEKINNNDGLNHIPPYISICSNNIDLSKLTNKFESFTKKELKGRYITTSNKNGKKILKYVKDKNGMYGDNNIDIDKLRIRKVTIDTPYDDMVVFNNRYKSAQLHAEINGSRFSGIV